MRTQIIEFDIRVDEGNHGVVGASFLDAVERLNRDPAWDVVKDGTTKVERRTVSVSPIDETSCSSSLATRTELNMPWLRTRRESRASFEHLKQCLPHGPARHGCPPEWMLQEAGADLRRVRQVGYYAFLRLP